MSEGPEPLPRYAVISTVKDEARHFARTADSLAAQTVRPERWVVVDDGSRDGTREIAARYAAEHPWITVVDSDRTAPRARGAGIVQAFQRGEAALAERPEVVVKLDGDVYLPPHYFEWVMRTFAREPRAGIVGGVILEHDGAVWRPAGFDPRHVRGALKAYRTTCLDAMGGLRASMGWDGMDEYGARARGFEVFVLTELVVLHYKPRGSKQHWFRARFEEGCACHHMGYLGRFVLARLPRRALMDHPPLVGALALVAGYGYSRLTRAPMIDDDLGRAGFQAEQRVRLRGLLRRRGQLPPELPREGGPAFWSGGRAEDEDRARPPETDASRLPARALVLSRPRQRRRRRRTARD